MAELDSGPPPERPLPKLSPKRKRSEEEDPELAALMAELDAPAADNPDRSSPTWWPNPTSWTRRASGPPRTLRTRSGSRPLRELG